MDYILGCTYVGETKFNPVKSPYFGVSLFQQLSLYILVIVVSTQWPQLGLRGYVWSLEQLGLHSLADYYFRGPQQIIPATIHTLVWSLLTVTLDLAT